MEQYKNSILDNMAKYWPRYHHDLWKWFAAQLKAESNFNPQAVSPVGAQGIAQFMPATWEDMQRRLPHLADKTPYDVEAAIEAQVYYVRWIMDYLWPDSLDVRTPDGETKLLISMAAYNWGIGNVKKLLDLPEILIGASLPEETRDYINRIYHYVISHR